MPKYRCYGTVRVEVSVLVEADDPEAASEAADEAFSGLTNYCGNGGTDKLIGPHDIDGQSVEDIGDFPETWHIERIEED